MRPVKPLGPDGNEPDEDLPPETPPIHAPQMYACPVYRALLALYSTRPLLPILPPAVHGTALPLSLIAISCSIRQEMPVANRANAQGLNSRRPGRSSIP